MCGRLLSINVSFWCLSVFCETIFGQFIQVVVFGEKYGANDIAIFRLIGLVWVRFNYTFCLPVLIIGCKRVQHQCHFRSPLDDCDQPVKILELSYFLNKILQRQLRKKIPGRLSLITHRVIFRLTTDEVPPDGIPLTELFFVLCHVRACRSGG